MSTRGTLNRKSPRRGQFVLKRQDDSENPTSGMEDSLAACDNKLGGGQVVAKADFAAGCRPEVAQSCRRYSFTIDHRIVGMLH
jgi:hypothetical protein